MVWKGLGALLEYGLVTWQVKDIFLHTNLCHTSCLILIPVHTHAHEMISPFLFIPLKKINSYTIN